MQNSQLLPFERNRYYIGKLLTSADFEAEQAYFNNKRRFLNTMMFGEGIVCGLSTYNLDDMSIMIESGVALDGLGREIVLDSPVMKKLSAIDGYEKLTGDKATLCLRYDEEPVRPVYSLVRQSAKDEEYELNRVRENWKLVLIDDEEKGPSAKEPGKSFLSQAQIYYDGDFLVTVTMPSAVSCMSRVKCVFRVQKLTEANRAFAANCVIQTPAFRTDSGEREFRVGIDERQMNIGESIVIEKWLTANSQPAEGSMIVSKAGQLKFLINSVEKRSDDNLLMKVSVCDIPNHELIESGVGSVNLEARQLSSNDGNIAIARISLQRTKSACIIDSIAELGVKKYIPVAGGDRLRQEYSSYFSQASEGGSSSPSAAASAQQLSPAEASEPVYATGVCEIPLGVDTKRGEVLFSDEIMHGLGRGNIFVDVGFEYLTEERRTKEMAKCTIYGNPELFAKETPPVPFAQTSVKVLNERGSFIIAARLTRPTSFVVLVLRWVAMRLPNANERGMIHKLAGKSISAVTPTVLMGPKETHYFSVGLKDMEPCSLMYELTEKDSGEISSDGIYTAPGKEGVYEIRISCSDTPVISTFAYAVVKKKNSEE